MPIGEATQLTLGLRYTIEDRSVRANGERLFDNPPFVRPIPGLPLLAQEPLRNSDTFRELTWRASLDRHFSDELMGYVSASRGFQSGGWNLQTPQNPAFGPETLDDFEAGLKYVDRSRRFRADANVFYYDYSDLQVSALTPIGQATTNAASAEIYGLELQLDARLGQRTDVTFGAQLLQARFKRFPNATCTNFSHGAAVPYAPITCDVTGNRLPFAPEVQVQCRRKPPGLAGQERHFAAERKPGLQFRLFRGTRQCRAAGSLRNGRCIGGMAADPARPIGPVLGAQSHRCPLLQCPGDRADRRRSSQPGCSAAVWRLDRLCFLARLRARMAGMAAWARFRGKIALACL